MPSPSPRYFSRQVEAARRFHLPKNVGKHLLIESGGREECSAFYNVDRERFPHYMLEFISRGSARIQLGTENWTLQPGSIYAYDGNLPHRLASASPDGMTKYFLVLKGAGARALLSRHGIRLGHVVKVGDFQKIAEIFEDLIHAGSAPRRGREEDCSALLRHLLLKTEELTVSHEHITSGAYSAYRKCRDHMAQHFLELRSVADLAKACALDQAYLCRLFQRFGEHTPYKCLLDLRMNHAIRRLASEAISAKALSEELGFADPASFSRCFKRTFGVPPHESQKAGRTAPR